MQTKNETLICLADGHQGRLILCDISSEGRCKPTELGRYRRKDVEPGDRNAGPGRRRATRERFDSAQSERNRRHAKGVMAWMSDRIRRHGTRQVLLMAGPRLLSNLGRYCPARLRGRIRTVPCDLAHLDATSVTAHPAVRQAIGLQTPKRP